MLLKIFMPAGKRGQEMTYPKSDQDATGTIWEYVTVFPFYSFSDRLRYVLVAIGGLLDSIVAVITLGNIKTELELPLIV